VHGERVPCSLGYHFIIRDNDLHVAYFIRSCDFYRHFRDDIYLTCRLAQWVLGQCKLHAEDEDMKFWAQVGVGTIHMHMTSLHCFRGDLPKLEREYGI
jgi:thymidylate synthase